MVSGLGGGRTVSRPGGRGSRFADCRSRDSGLWRSCSFSCQLDPVGSGARRSWSQSKYRDLFSRLDRNRLWDSSRTLRSCICDARTNLSREGQKLDHHAHLVRRIFEHDLLAAKLVAGPNDGVAVHLLNLRGSTACNKFADLLAPLAAVANPKAEVTETASLASAIPVRKNMVLVFGLLAAAITFSAVIQSTMSVHLLNILQNRGVALMTVVVLGTFVGPSQVLARVVEMIVGRRFHPIWTIMRTFPPRTVVLTIKIFD
jgi:hypothetical protein